MPTVPAPLPIPSSPSDLTPGWLTAVLVADGTLGQGETVTGITIESVGEGLGVLSTTVRARITSSASTAPATLILKFSSTNRLTRAVGVGLGMYAREVEVYRHAAELGVPMPRCHHGAFDEANGDHVLVLEDMIDFAGTDQLAGDVAAVRASLETLAELHATWWHEAQDAIALTWLPYTVRAEPVAQLFDRFMGPFAEQWGDRVGPEGVNLARRTRAALDQLVDELVSGPMTLLHGDTRLDNVLLPRSFDGATLPVLIDWQVAMTGPSPFDVAYLLAGSLRVEVRREAEEDLVNAYLGALRDRLTKRGISVDVSRWRRQYEICALVQLYLPMANGGGLGTTDQRGQLLSVMSVDGHFAMAHDHGGVLDTL